MRQRGEICQGVRLVALVVDHIDQVILISGLGQGIDCRLETRTVIAAGNEDGDRGPVVGHDGLENGAACRGCPRGVNCAATHAAAVKCLLDRAAACFKTRRLAMSTHRGRAGNHAPVVENLRYMANLSRAFTGAQPKVMVLRAFESDTDAANIFVQPSANAREMARIAEGEQELGRPVGLELRGMTPAADVDLVIVAINQVGLRMGIEIEREMSKRVTFQQVVVVKEDKEFPPGRGGSLVRRHRDVAIFLAVDRPDPTVTSRLRCHLLTHSEVGTGIVDKNQLPAGKRLLDHAGDHLLERAQGRVVDGNQDREPRHIESSRQESLYSPSPPRIFPIHPDPGVV